MDVALLSIGPSLTARWITWPIRCEAGIVRKSHDGCRSFSIISAIKVKKNGPCIGCGWRKGAPVKQIWIPFQCSQFLKMHQVASPNFHDRWLSSAKSMVLSDSRLLSYQVSAWCFADSHVTSTDFRQSAKSAPYTGRRGSLQAGWGCWPF